MRKPQHHALKVHSVMVPSGSEAGDLTVYLTNGSWLTWVKGDTVRAPQVGDMVMVQLPIIVALGPRTKP